MTSVETMPHTATALEDLAALVDCESPSDNAAATARCADLVDDLARRRLGTAAERLVSQGHTHLRWRFGNPRVLLLGHLDTVWPLGTTARWPFVVEGDRASGPGAFDMKAGLVQLFHALGELPDLDGVAVLVTSDEEIGSPTSSHLVTETAAGLDAVLVLEPSSDGALKLARKGVASYTIDVTGRAAHAGLEPERGINAAVELAHQTLGIAELGRPDLGTTVTPTVVSAGTTVNTVPATARLAVDTRATTVTEQRRVDEAIRGLRPVLPGASLTVTALATRPPLERERSQRLFEQARAAAADLGLPSLSGVEVGGGSDGNLTAALGVDTLDGVGAVGGNAHAEGEWVQVSLIAQRAELVTAIVARLLDQDPALGRQSR